MFKRLSFLLLFLSVQIFPVFSMEEEVLRDLFDYEPLYSLRGCVGHCCFSPNGRHIAIELRPPQKFSGFHLSDQEFKICILDIGTGRVLHFLKEGTKGTRFMKFSSDGMRFVAKNSRELYVWDVETGMLLNNQEGGEDYASAPALSALSYDCRYSVATNCRQNKLFVWDVETGELLQEFHTDDDSRILSVVFCSDGKSFKVLINNFKIFVVNLDGGEISKIISLYERYYKERFKESSLNFQSFSPDGRFVVSVLGSATFAFLRMWNAHTGASLWEKYKSSDYFTDIYSLEFNFDGTRIAVKDSNGVQILDVVSGDFIQTLKEDIRKFFMDCELVVRFSPDDIYMIAQNKVSKSSDDYFPVITLYRDRNNTRLQEIAFASVLHPRLGEESPANVLPQDLVREILSYI